MSSWRKYGGTDSFEKISDIRVNSLVTNYFTILNGITNDVDISGNLSVSKRFDVFGDVSFNKNLSVAGNVNISKDLEISGNVHILKDQIVDGNITVLDHLYFQMDVNNHYMYGNENGIGINKYYPEAEIDICGNQQCVLNVKSTLVNTKNILCRNVSDQSIILSVDACNATIGFFHDIPLSMNALNAYPDAMIKYTDGGTLTIDSSSNIQVINNLIVSDISSNKVYDSTITVYNELTDKVFLYDSYNVASARNSNAICNVAVDNSSNVGINLITKYNQSGAAIYGGVYPKNVNRKMLSFGTTDFSNHLYVPAQTIVSGSSRVVYKNTTGINRCTPKVDSYAVDVNGPIHIENIDITTAANVPFQLNTMRFSRKYPKYGVAVGGVYKYSNTISNNYHSQQAYITTDTASSWYENSFLINNLNDTLQPIFTSYVYDSSYILIYGGTGIGFYLDISNNTWLSKRMQNQQIGEGDYAVVDMLITDSSGNKNSNNLSSKVFFIMANQTRDSFQLRYFNAAFGKSADYYNTANINSIQNGDPAKYVLYKNNGFSYNNSLYENKYDDALIEDYVSIFFRYELGITGRCIDGYSFPITTNPGTGYIYIAGKYDIRKYLYSDNLFNEITIDVVEQYDCSHNPTITPEYNAINVYDLSYVVAVGNGIISYTKDGGNNWTDISKNTADLTIEGSKLRSVYAYDLSNAIAVGDNRKMLYTTNGTTWKNIPPLLLDLSGTGFPLVDASLNDVFIFNKNAFVVSNRVSSFAMNADVSNIGNAKIVYNYVPELMNGENNSVLDLCGNMTIAGNIIIDRVNGNICSTANNFYISSNTPYTYIGDGIGSNKVSIGNANGSVLINANCDVSYNMRIDGSGGLTIANGDIYMPNGLLTADRANIANFSMGVLDINGGTETSRNPDLSYALHVGGYRPAVRFDASMSVQSLYVDNDAILYGNIVSRSTTSPALLVQNAKAQFEYGIDVISNNGIVNITGGLPVSLDPVENGGLYLQNGTGAKIDGNVFVMRNMYIQGEGSIPSLIVSSGQSVFNDIVVNGATATQSAVISSNLLVNGNTLVNKLDVSGNLDMSGNLTVRGNTLVNKLDVSGNLDMSGNLTLSGVSSNINLSGASGLITFPSGEIQTNSATATFNETTTSEGVVYSLSKYLNSTINFTSNQLTSIFLPTPITGRYLKIFNNCNFAGTLRISAITGTAGITTTTLTVQSIVGTLVVGSVLSISGKIVTITAFGTGTGGVGNYTITPSQATPISNGTDFTASILTNTFTGEWGNSDPSVSLNPNSWSLLYATNTTSWSVIDRSAKQIFNNIAVTASITYEPHYNLLNSYVPFDSASSAFLVTIPAPTAIFSRNKYIKIVNVNASNTLTISNSANFLGNYGSNATSISIPIGCWIEINSNGTNWLVNDRSQNFNFFINPASTTFNWSNDLQYLDSTVTFNQPTATTNPSIVIFCTCSVSGSTGTPSNGNILTVSLITAGGTNISAGSVLSFDNFVRTYIIRCQLTSSEATGIAGGAGTYLIDYFGTAINATGVRIKPSGASVGIGTYSQNANQNSFYSTAVFNTGTVTTGMTVSQANTSSTIINQPFNVLNQVSGTTWNVTQNTKTSLTTVAYFSTATPQVQIPTPSASNTGRIIKFVNTSFNPVNIVVSAGASVFSGKYAQINCTANLVASYAISAPGFGHLLRSGDTVVLLSNGSSWITQEGTSFGGVKTFGSFPATAISTNTADRTKNECAVFNLDQTLCNLTGIGINNNSTKYIISNYYNYTVTIEVQVYFNWSASDVSSSTLPLRQISLEQFNADHRATKTVYSSLTPISCNFTDLKFVPTAAITNQQNIGGIFSLKSGDNVILQNAKINGTSTAENFTDFTINVSRIG